MKRLTYFITTMLFFLVLLSTGDILADTPWLHVSGNEIQDPSGNRVMLRGISLIDLGAQEMYYDKNVMEVIDLITNKNDTSGSSPGWYPNVLRLPICPPEYEGPLPYTPGSDDLYNDLLRPVVDYCASKDVYCIIDLHYVDPIESNPTYVEQFWTYMAQKFANDSHVLFELFNEPSNDTDSDTADWETVRPYMQEWANLVRSYAPDNLILIGTPAYCGILSPCVSNPISGTNIVYVVHTYWVHWPYQYFRDEMINLSSVAPLIMTEWGFSTSNGDASTITEYGQPLDDFREQYGIGNTAWVASTDWGPPMFYEGWTLRVGEGEMGGFVKDRLYALQGGGTTTTSATTSTTTTAATTSTTTTAATTSTTTTAATTTTTSGGGCDCGTCDWYGTNIPICCESCSGWGWYDGGCRRSCVCPSSCEGGCVGSQCGSTTTTAATTSTTTTAATTSTTTTAATTSTTTTAATTSTTTTAATTSTTTTAATTSTTTTAATTSTTTTSGGGCDCGTCNWWGTNIPMCCESCSGWGWYDGGCCRSCVCPSSCEGGSVP